ncbi:Protein kinase C-binding protein NELL1 [Blattella germanica]|nr:Protein kinase C-binding protein NELL1 [Blattella germanica]
MVSEHRDLRLNAKVYEKAVELLRNNSEFTVAASLRQEEANVGTILSFAHGTNRYLELQSSGRKDEIRFHYKVQHESTAKMETFPFRLADNEWHKVAVSVSGAQVELLVDCHPLYRRIIRPLDRNFTVPQLGLWVGQRSRGHSYFKGALQEVHLISGPHGYLAQCPHLSSSCPTCGQFSLLQNTVEQLTKHLHELSERLVAAEGRINRVEECDCQKSCRHGEIQCRPVQCPSIRCKNPVINPGECCPSCLKQCYLRGEMYDHGESVNPKECVECECLDGVMKCKRIDPDTMCPPLSCSPQDQFSVPGNCCKFCKDVDECQQEGGLEGHHCHSNTRCVNTNGSYICECLPGYRRLDKFNCVELDECSTGEHACHEHADCVCGCVIVAAVCNQTCLNGGECLSPGNCTCRKGYVGPSCELDLDECASNLHRCHKNSVCVNMPGWYYCRCKPGYRSILHDSSHGPICQDIDECQEGTHTCHPSARCMNNEGGFQCTCPRDRGPDCKLIIITVYGEIDCWAMECPPLTCSNPILNPGDCCPRCQDDPCGLDSSNSSLSAEGGGKPCTYLGHLYESGSQWKDPYDKCTACNCKDGRLCCNYDFRCTAPAGQPISIPALGNNGRIGALDKSHGVVTGLSLTRENVSESSPPQAQVREANDSDSDVSGGKDLSEFKSGNSDAVPLFVSSAAVTTEVVHTSEDSGVSERGTVNETDPKTNNNSHVQKRESIMKQAPEVVYLTEEEIVQDED